VILWAFLHPLGEHATGQIARFWGVRTGGWRRMRRAGSNARKHSLRAGTSLVSDKHVLRQLDQESAIVATNNALVERQIHLSLPEGFNASEPRDALTGAKLASVAGHVQFTIPPLYGMVLVSSVN